MMDTEWMHALESYRAARAVPDNFSEYWHERKDLAQKTTVLREEVLPFRNPMARYSVIRFTGTDGTILEARCLCPRTAKPVPTVLLFHDIGRDVRGWHHMLRFSALGYAVFALKNRSGWEDGADLYRQDIALLYCDALCASYAALSLDSTDPSNLMAFGEGFGGGLAIVSAAMMGRPVRCAALNPMPADVPEPFCSMDLVHFAPLLTGSFLLGTGLLDTVAAPEGQYAILHSAVCPSEHHVYVRHEHERNNFFEDELLRFFR
ncbi:MAG: acetylxylan esterase [Eubacteriales bacterium]|nr:acetylxylan esterase [Eubacteriales bacterium]